MDFPMADHACESCSGKYCAKKAPIFSMLADDQLAEITRLIVRRKFKKGQVFFLEGDVSDKFYIINKGKIKIYKYTKEGKEQILYILSEGDFIGDLSLLKKSRIQFNAEALETVSVCILAKDDFDKRLRENPEIALKILENLHDRLISMENLVQTLSTKDIEARIAGLLLNFSESFGVQQNGERVIELALSREEMANYIGVTRETMSRKLTSLQDEGIIDSIGNKKIIIKDMDRLKALS